MKQNTFSVKTLACTLFAVAAAAPAPGSPWQPIKADPWHQSVSWPTPSWARPCYTPTATVSSPAGASPTVMTTTTTSVTAPTSGSGSPSATIKNGTVVGVHSNQYNQDFFLGIPYAQPPLGNLRFRNPQSINASFSGVYSATQYSTECVGYGSDQWPYAISEDCLYLNIIRPGNYSAYKEPLPIGFWMHGGGNVMGGGIDQRYNLSFIVENSVEIGKPIIGISINYRLSAWGFLASKQVQGSGQTNIGLRDQRLALKWVNENVAAFGGDPSRVTIWGESAGATDSGWQLIAYNGRNDSLISGAIMESGNSISGSQGLDYYQPRYNALVNMTGCANAADNLQCLRDLPFNTLNAAINTTLTGWGPIVDGDFIERFGSIQLAEGAFLKVPIVDGTNSDEGISFGRTGINTTDQFVAGIVNGTISPGPGLPMPLAQQLVDTYLSYNICTLPPLTLGCGQVPPNRGALYRYVAAYAGDAVFLANKRQQCATWAANGVPAYCYRFNAQPAGNNIYSGVPHFQEVAFVFDNENGVGYPPIAVDPFQGKPQNFFDLARLMSKSWASFIHSGNPNDWALPAGSPAWPVYSVNAPMNQVWDANVTGLAYAEPDTFRAQGQALINSFNIAYNR